MKKSLFIISALFFILFVFNSCKQHKIKTATEQLIGIWTGTIEEGEWCDTNNYNTVVLELQENNIALLNYSGPDGDRWNTSYECKWWIERHKATNPFVFDVLGGAMYNFLYISVKDTLWIPCFCDEISYYWISPDTASYQIFELEEKKTTLTGGKLFRSCYINLLFAKCQGNVWVGTSVQTLYKQD